MGMCEKRCFICGRLAITAYGDCCSRKHQQFLWDVRRSQDQYRTATAVEGITQALLQWCKHENNYRLSLPSRIFYTLKALTCLAFGWVDTKGYGFETIRGVAVWGEEFVGGEYSAWEWNEFQVGYGVFSNWVYDIERCSSA